MKRKYIIISVVLFLLLLLVVFSYGYCEKRCEIGSVASRIMREIDNSSTEECVIDLQNVTDFEWDKAVVVSADFWCAGYSEETISELWGFSYEVPKGFRSGLIFLNGDEIVYEEYYAADIERSSEFNVSIYPMPYYRILKLDDCKVVGGEEEGRYSILVE